MGLTFKTLFLEHFLKSCTVKKFINKNNFVNNFITVKDRKNLSVKYDILK
jgi:hypothetical protein